MRDVKAPKSLDEQVDNTETTIDDDEFDDECGEDMAQWTSSDSDSNRESPKNGKKKKTTQTSASQCSDSLEASLVELQHELLERKSQCSALREMLASVSGSVQEQLDQIQNQTMEIKSLKRRLRKAMTECKEWKEKYEALSKSVVQNESTISSTPNRADPLLGTLPDPGVNEQPESASQESSHQSADDVSNENEATTNYNNEDLSQENYDSDDLDVVFRPRRNRKLRFSEHVETQVISCGSNTEDDFGFSDDDGLISRRQTSGFKSKIRRSVRLGVFKKKTTAQMDKKKTSTVKVCDDASVGSSGSEDCYVLEELPSAPPSARMQMNAKQLSTESLVSEDSGFNALSEAEKRRNRIRRQARKEAKKAAFDVQQLEC
jgi:phage terminase Nu1 subunit (DNA packaging protein)